MIALSSNEPAARAGARGPRPASLQGERHALALYPPGFIPGTTEGPENSCLIRLGSCQADKAWEAPAVGQEQDENRGWGMKPNCGPDESPCVGQDELGCDAVTSTPLAPHLRLPTTQLMFLLRSLFIYLEREKETGCTRVKGREKQAPG